MKKTAIFPGTFDPFTVGHYSIVQRALQVFDEIVVAVGQNTFKKNYFQVEKRVEIARQAFQYEPRVQVTSYNTLTVDFAKEIGAEYIVRGIRTVADFEYERSVADANRQMANMETLLLFTEPQHSFISSTVVRELLTYGKDISAYLPPNVEL